MTGFFAQLVLVLVVLWPLLLAGTMILPAARSMAWSIGAWAALPAVLSAILAPVGVSLHLPWLLIGSRLGVPDETSHIFLLFTALLWLLSGIYARSYQAQDPNRSRFLVFYLLAMTGNFGLILAQDLTSFYLFFTLMSFASYGLVVHMGSREALYAAKVYMVMVVIGEVALFAALVLAIKATGATEFAAVRQGLALAEGRDLVLLLAFIGFGIKAGVLGLHVWLPLAHPVAPTPASAVLSGAMIKAGLLGWLRIMPLGEVMLPQWGQLFMFFGLAAAFYGVLRGLMQQRPKTLLAYSSISQMGLMTMAVGLGLIAPKAWPAILVVIGVYALHHGLSKAALFLGVGVITACSGVRRRWLWLTMWLPALALAGAPLTGGMVVKGLLKAQTGYAPAPWDMVLQTLLPGSAVATTLLVGRFMVLLYQSPANPAQAYPVGLIWPWALLVFLAAVLPWWVVPPSSILWSPAGFLQSLWPVLLGLGLTLIAQWWQGHRDRHSPAPPDNQEVRPDDLLKHVSHNVIPAFLHSWRTTQLSQLGELRWEGHWWQILGRVETGLSRWPVAVVLLILLGLFLTGTAIFD